MAYKLHGTALDRTARRPSPASYPRRIRAAIRV